MAKNEIQKAKCDPNTDDECFFRLLGDYIKFLRINAGFATPEAFANVMGMSRSQYSAYEVGKNLTLTTFKKLLFQFNIKVEDWLNVSIMAADKDSFKINATVNQGRIEQVIEEVRTATNSAGSNDLSFKEAQRYVSVLIFCTSSKSRADILTMLKLSDTVNTFKRVAGRLIDLNWLEFTDKKSKNSPQQRYVTSPKGKDILKINN